MAKVRAQRDVCDLALSRPQFQLREPLRSKVIDRHGLALTGDLLERYRPAPSPRDATMTPKCGPRSGRRSCAEPGGQQPVCGRRRATTLHGRGCHAAPSPVSRSSSWTAAVVAPAWSSSRSAPLPESPARARACAFARRNRSA
jgi:hypothetical protein